MISTPQPIYAMQEGCSYLIARTPDGKLDLRDIYVHDTDLDISGRPEVHGEVPEQPLYYQAYPWIVQFTGDRINGKMPWKRVSAPASLLLMHPYPFNQPVGWWELGKCMHCCSQRSQMKPRTDAPKRCI